MLYGTVLPEGGVLPALPFDPLMPNKLIPSQCFFFWDSVFGKTEQGCRAELVTVKAEHSLLNAFIFSISTYRN